MTRIIAPLQGWELRDGLIPGAMRRATPLRTFGALIPGAMRQAVESHTFGAYVEGRAIEFRALNAFDYVRVVILR